MRKKQIYQVDIQDNTIKIITEKLSQYFSRIKGFISLVVVLGITWISFVLYIHEFGQYFSYIFIILNGLQVCYQTNNVKHKSLTHFSILNISLRVCSYSVSIFYLTIRRGLWFARHTSKTYLPILISQRLRSTLVSPPTQHKSQTHID